jgi:hypothetical protein
VQFVTSSYDFLPKTLMADKANIFHAIFRLYMAAGRSFLRDLPHEWFFYPFGRLFFSETACQLFQSFLF